MELTNDFLKDICDYIYHRISAVLYISEGKASAAELRSVEIADSGNVRIEAAIERTGIKIDELQLYGLNGHLWARQKTDITLNQDDNDAGVIFRLEIDLKEAMVNV